VFGPAPKRTEVPESFISALSPRMEKAEEEEKEDPVERERVLEQIQELLKPLIECGYLTA
jgi:hypothetical protein